MLRKITTSTCSENTTFHGNANIAESADSAFSSAPAGVLLTHDAAGVLTHSLTQDGIRSQRKSDHACGVDIDN